MTRRSLDSAGGVLHAEDRRDINDMFTQVGKIAGATIAYAAHASTTDGLVATITLVDPDGATVTGVHALDVWISRDAAGIGVTATSASGTLTATTGAILSAVTAKKHVKAVTAATGILVLLLVDSANTTGERFCVANPVSGAAIVGPAALVTDYEGGA